MKAVGKGSWFVAVAVVVMMGAGCASAKKEVAQLPTEGTASGTVVTNQKDERGAGANDGAGLSGEIMTTPIYFDYDSATLSSSSRQSLTELAPQLQRARQVRVRVEGHTDDRGSDEYNIALGERRAKAAVDYLVAMGVPTSRVTLLSLGEEQPAELGRDEDAWSRNRRAEFRVD